jgi:hypothetical protein
LALGGVLWFLCDLSSEERILLMRPYILLVLCCLFSGVSFAQSEPSRDAKATLIFFREGHFTGSALKPSIYVDGKETMRLANGRWFSVEVEPGKHNLGSSAKNEPETVVNLAPNETAYVEMVITMGTWRGGGRLITVDSGQAEPKVRKLKPMTDTKD